MIGGLVNEREEERLGLTADFGELFVPGLWIRVYVFLILDIWFSKISFELWYDEQIQCSDSLGCNMDELGKKNKMLKTKL